MVARKLNFRKKDESAFQNIILLIVFVLIFGGLLTFFIFQNVKIGQKRGDLEDNLGVLQAQVGELSARKRQLQESIKETQSQYYEEKILREQGLYKKPGEEVVTILVPEEEQQAEVETEEEKRVWWNPFTWVGNN